jgi:hypothetical protein
MRLLARPFGSVALAAVSLLVLAFAASPAQAAFGVDEWQSLTCTENEDIPPFGGSIEEEPPLPEGEPCTKETSSKWFKQAAGHPPFGITDLILNTLTGPGAEGFPDGFVKDIVVETPEGLSVNPEALAKCSLEQAETNIFGCPAQTIVGVNYLTAATEAPGAECVPKCEQKRVAAPVYNIEPFFGHPSMVAFPNSAGEAVYIVGSLDPEDQHVTFTISDIESPLEGGAPLVRTRLVFDEGEAALGPGLRFGNGTYLTLPSECGSTADATVKVDSHEGDADERTFPSPYVGEGCDEVPFDPTIETSVDSATDSPEPVTLNLGIPFDPEEPVANSYLKTAKVTLPEGAGINPSLANGLETCSNAQFAYHTNDPIQCPAGSEIGTVDVQTPSLPPDSLHGKVYVAEPESQDPSSGKQFRIFLTVQSERYGVNVRLRGQIFPNLQTGQITAVVDENPQATFREFIVHLNGGARGALTSPNTCGPHKTTTDLTPWTETGDAQPSGEFNLTTTPGRGPCAQKLGERPFNPGFGAGPHQHGAGEFSPFRLNISRWDGAQEIRRVDANLPPGMVASLAGVPYCPEASIAAAAANSGKAERSTPSCPAASQVGEVETAVGSGPAPFHTRGKVYLAGPYKGAPISMVFVNPAVAGPYDLGTVVVRAALNIDPETAEVHAVSDPIPYVFGGVKLDVKGIEVQINRPRFTLNPTTCRSSFLVGGHIFGGGENPANPAAWFESRQGTPFQATNCRALQFKPKFYARIFGGKKQTQRAKNPKFRAILEARKGDANVRRAAFILPRATILDQGHIKTICTRVQLAAGNCPKNAIYGYAKAISPLLDKPLKGPVYLTSSSHELPDLLADLHGQVPIRLRGVISGKNARLKTVFNETPDVAVSKFILNMKGGSKGLVVNSRNLCKSRTSGYLNLKAQNSRRLKDKNLRLNIPACRR